MKHSPSIPQIRKWLRDKNPLGLFQDDAFSIRDIDPKPWSGHFNYFLTSGQKRFVLRFKGPEWGEPTRGISDEYKILEYVRSYKVAPQPFFFSKDFFGESVLFEEFLDGKPFSSFGQKEQLSSVLPVGRFLARMRGIAVNRKRAPFRARLVSYTPHKKEWKEKLTILKKDRRTNVWADRIAKLLPRAGVMLNSFEPRLRRVLRRSGFLFVFISAHAGHLLKTKDGFRFFNWEQVGYGDPSYSPAVFLGSISSSLHFEEMKKKLLSAYQTEDSIPEFEKLIDARLAEREVSNLLWVLWAYAQTTKKTSSEQETSVVSRFGRVKKLLSQNFSHF